MKLRVSCERKLVRHISGMEISAIICVLGSFPHYRDRDLRFLGEVYENMSFLPSMCLLGSMGNRSHQLLYQDFLNGKRKSAQIKLI